VLEIRGVSKRFGNVTALQPTDLMLGPGTVSAIIGPSGCGKSTLLRTINGLIEPDTGEIRLHGEPVGPQGIERLRQRMGYVIQDGGLFPHLTARGNVELLPRWLRRPSQWIDERLGALVRLTRFPESGLDRYPAELSGGQVQRVALMRALMLQPEVLLLDEPMAALDPLVRSRLQTDLREIFQELGSTVVLVTHDLAEAAYLAERIVLLRAGAIVQEGTVGDLFERPAQEFVREFIGAQRPPWPLSDPSGSTGP